MIIQLDYELQNACKHSETTDFCRLKWNLSYALKFFPGLPNWGESFIKLVLRAKFSDDYVKQRKLSGQKPFRRGFWNAKTNEHSYWGLEFKVPTWNFQLVRCVVGIGDPPLKSLSSLQKSGTFSKVTCLIGAYFQGYFWWSLPLQDFPGTLSESWRHQVGVDPKTKSD